MIFDMCYKFFVFEVRNVKTEKSDGLTSAILSSVYLFEYKPHQEYLYFGWKKELGPDIP